MQYNIHQSKNFGYSGKKKKDKKGKIHQYLMTPSLPSGALFCPLHIVQGNIADCISGGNIFF